MSRVRIETTTDDGLSIAVEIEGESKQIELWRRAAAGAAAAMEVETARPFDSEPPTMPSPTWSASSEDGPSL